MEKGATLLSILLFAAFLIFLLLGINFAFVEFNINCGDLSFQECLSKKDDKKTELPKQDEMIVATGTFGAKKYSIVVTMNIPKNGGAVTGNVTGTCDAKITGINEGGKITGQAFGSCSPFYVPVSAKATFTGNIIDSIKSIPINGEGSAAGITKEGTITLTYK